MSFCTGPCSVPYVSKEHTDQQHAKNQQRSQPRGTPPSKSANTDGKEPDMMLVITVPEAMTPMSRYTTTSQRNAGVTQQRQRYKASDERCVIP